MPSKTAEPERSSTASSDDAIKGEIFDTLSSEDALYGPGRRNRMCYTYLDHGVPVSYLVTLFDRHASTILKHARKGRIDLKNRNCPWHFVPARIARRLHGEMIEFKGHRNFANLLANLDNAEKFIITPYAASAIRHAARMPQRIKQELAADLAAIQAIKGTAAKETLMETVQCSMCQLPVLDKDIQEARRYGRAVLCESCLQMCRDEIHALYEEARYASR